MYSLRPNEIKKPELKRVTAEQVVSGFNLSTHPTMRTGLEDLEQRLLQLAKKMCSFQVYKIKRKSRSPVSKEFVGELNYSKYKVLGAGARYGEKAIQKTYNRLNPYLTGQKQGKRKYKKYPYSRRRPSPPIPPSLVNIQSGRLLQGMKIGSTIYGGGKQARITLRNDDIHFYFIVSSAAEGSQQRMMARPFLRDFYRLSYHELQSVQRKVRPYIQERVYKRMAGDKP